MKPVKLIVTAVMGLLMISAAACNTIAGVGKDITEGAETVKKEIED